MTSIMVGDKGFSNGVCVRVLLQHPENMHIILYYTEVMPQGVPNFNFFLFDPSFMFKY